MVEIDPMVLKKKIFICILLFRIYFILEKRFGRTFKQSYIPFTKRCFVLNLVEIGPLVLEEKILNFVNVFSLFRKYLPLKNGVALHLNKNESPSPKNALCKVKLKVVYGFLRRR